MPKQLYAHLAVFGANLIYGLHKLADISLASTSQTRPPITYFLFFWPIWGKGMNGL